MTKIIVTDQALIEQILRAKTGVFRDPEGRLLGSFAAAEPPEEAGEHGDNRPAPEPPGNARGPA